jgi:hypothetical protein
MAEALAEVTSSAAVPAPAELAAAATGKLHSARAMGDERGAAYELLAADALLTAALERAAELGMAELELLLTAWEPAGVGRLESGAGTIEDAPSE